MSRRMWVAACVAVLAGVLPPAANAGVIGFDSVAEFSATQGQGGWQYGYYATAGSAASFHQLSTYIDDKGAADTSRRWAASANPPPWNWLWNSGAHPALDPTDLWTVRRWTAGMAGDLALSGDYQRLSFGTTRLQVIVDGHAVWSGTSANANQLFSINVHVNQGSTVDFTVDAGDRDEHGDSTRFVVRGSVTPVAIPEPASIAVMLAGLAALATGRRRAHRRRQP